MATMPPVVATTARVVGLVVVAPGEVSSPTAVVLGLLRVLVLVAVPTSSWVVAAAPLFEGVEALPPLLLVPPVRCCVRLLLLLVAILPVVLLLLLLLVLAAIVLHPLIRGVLLLRAATPVHIAASSSLGAIWAAGLGDAVALIILLLLLLLLHRLRGPLQSGLLLLGAVVAS